MSMKKINVTLEEFKEGIKRHTALRKSFFSVDEEDEDEDIDDEDEDTEDEEDE